MDNETGIPEENKFGENIAEKEKRKLKAMRENSGRVWSGLGVFGMVGWSVVVPTLLGAALGIWLDKRNHQSFSWTLTCLIVGLISGSVIAWYWIEKEDKTIHKNNNGDNE